MDQNQDMDLGQQDTGLESQGTEPEYAWDSEKNVLRYKDKELDAKAFGEVWLDHENKGKWQKEYTQRDMSLKEQARNLNKVKMLDDLLTKHPEAYSEIEAITKRIMGGTTGQTQVLPPEFNQALQEMKQLKETVESKEAYAEVRSEMEGVMSQYKNYFDNDPDKNDPQKNLRNQVIEYALNNNISNLKTAFRDLMFDKAQEHGLKEGQSKVADATKRRQGLSVPAGSRGGQSKQSLKGMSLTSDEFKRAMIEDSTIPEP